MFFQDPLKPSHGRVSRNSLSIEGVKSEEYMGWKGWIDAGHTEISKGGSEEDVVADDV